MSAKNTTLGADGQRHGATQSEGKFRKIVMQHKGLQITKNPYLSPCCQFFTKEEDG